MKVTLGRSGFVAGVIAAAAFLGGCTTYGTGVNPGSQTVHDIAGLVNVSGDKRAPIDYKPRPPITAPPAGAALPAPGSASVATASGDWPKDPDEAARARKAAAAKAAAEDPNYEPDIALPVRHDSSTDTANDPTTDREKDAKVRKLMAEAKAPAGFDSSGAPIRRTLIEPPVDYRAPDPSAPTEFKTAKKHWPWQKSTPDPNAGLPDDAATASSDEKTSQ
jgi:hypothetical protein